MIVRIVKMTFRADAVQTFKDLFSKHKEQIGGFEGCIALDLLQDVADDRIFITHSLWDSEHSLEQYRHSALFADIWPQTKALFDAPAEAWSLARLHHLPPPK